MSSYIKRKIRQRVYAGKYSPKYCAMIIRFFSAPPYRIVHKKEKANDPIFLGAFARKIGVTLGTLERWAETIPQFGLAYERAHQLREEFFVVNGLKGLYASTAWIFTMKNLFHWKDEQFLKSDGAIPITVYIPKNKAFDDRAEKTAAPDGVETVSRPAGIISSNPGV